MPVVTALLTHRSNVRDVASRQTSWPKPNDRAPILIELTRYLAQPDVQLRFMPAEALESLRLEGEELGWIDNDYLATWDDRQPDIEDPTPADRQRRRREKLKLEPQGRPDAIDNSLNANN